MIADGVEPFPVAVPERELKDLRSRLDRARLPETETVQDCTQGVGVGHLCDLWDGWRRPDWRRLEKRWNAIPRYRTDVDGLPSGRGRWTGHDRPSELTEHIGIIRSAISYQLQSLKKLGLVERLPAPNDRRAYLLAVTCEGRRRVADVQTRRSRQLGERLDSWFERDVRALTALLTKYNGSTARPHQHRW